VTSRISHATIDSRNAYQQSLWWSQVLGMREDPEDPNKPGHEECMIFSADGRTRILFVEVPEPKQIKNRLHFDLRPMRLVIKKSCDCSVQAPPRSLITADPTAAAG
jgi:Glyoxalase-like domain